jgi:hypothetical protein
MDSFHLQISPGKELRVVLSTNPRAKFTKDLYKNSNIPNLKDKSFSQRRKFFYLIKKHLYPTPTPTQSVQPPSKATDASQSTNEPLNLANPIPESTSSSTPSDTLLPNITQHPPEDLQSTNSIPPSSPSVHQENSVQCPSEPPPPELPLPLGYVKLWSETHDRFFYRNTETGAVDWTFPRAHKYMLLEGETLMGKMAALDTTDVEPDLPGDPVDHTWPIWESLKKIVFALHLQFNTPVDIDATITLIRVSGSNLMWVRQPI